MLHHLFNLPDDVLKQVVFLFVDVVDLMNVEEALRIGDEIQLQRFYMKIKDCILVGDTTVAADRSQLTWMYLHDVFIRKLRFPKGMSDNDLSDSHLLHLFKHLTHADFRDSRITSSSLIDITNYCLDLTSLYAHRYQRIDPDCIIDIDDYRHRKIKTNQYITFQPRKVIAKASFHSGLEHLDVSHCFRAYEGILHMVKHLKMLRHLYLQSCPDVVDTALQQIILHCPLLITFDISNTMQISLPTLKLLVTQCKHLEALYLSKVPEVSEDFIAFLVEQPHKLKLLDITGCRLIPAATMSHLTTSYPSLKIEGIDDNGNAGVGAGTGSNPTHVIQYHATVHHHNNFPPHHVMIHHNGMQPHHMTVLHHHEPNQPEQLHHHHVIVHHHNDPPPLVPHHVVLHHHNMPPHHVIVHHNDIPPNHDIPPQHVILHHHHHHNWMQHHHNGPQNQPHHHNEPLDHQPPHAMPHHAVGLHVHVSPDIWPLHFS